MIAAVSCALAAYEAVAIRTRRVPTVTDLSRRWPWEVLVWAWFAWLFVHLITERRRASGYIDH